MVVLCSGALRVVPALLAGRVYTDVRVVDGLVDGVALLLVGEDRSVPLRRPVVVQQGLALGRLHLVVLLGIVFVLLAA